MNDRLSDLRITPPWAGDAIRSTVEAWIHNEKDEHQADHPQIGGCGGVAYDC
jgi:hypothetical protein